jgi:hypothetical protein
VCVCVLCVVVSDVANETRVSQNPEIIAPDSKNKKRMRVVRNNKAQMSYNVSNICEPVNLFG